MKSNGFDGIMGLMVISLMGPSGVKCQVADFSVLVDPPQGKKGNLVIRTQMELSKGDHFPEEGMIVGPGEYEIAGVKVRGVRLGKESTKNLIKTIFKVAFDDIRLGFFSALTGNLDQEELNALGEVDVLFIDAEKSELTAKEMSSLIKKIEPSVIIPLTDKGAKKLLEESGQKVSAEEKFVIKAKDINPEEGTKLVWLKS